MGRKLHLSGADHLVDDLHTVEFTARLGQGFILTLVVEEFLARQRKLISSEGQSKAPHIGQNFRPT